MALKRSEKTLVGLMMVVGGLALLVMFGLPQFDALMTNIQRKQELENQLTSATQTRDILSSSVQELRRRTTQGSEINIRKYTLQDKEKQIKEILDQVVRAAGKTGNKFISLEPVEVPPLFTPPPPPTEEELKKAQERGEPPPEPPAKLDTFGYEFAIRGTYRTIQAFLKAMDDHTELMELHAIVLTNEAAEASVTDDVDFEHPIRLTAKLRMVLQPAF